ncbi:hypothetical protein AB1N83_011772 [Pleurotus pulmonarius]
MVPRFTNLAILAFFLAAGTQARPECAQQCFHEMIHKSDCDKTDVRCLCLDVKFVGLMAECARANCPSDQRDAFIEASNRTCAAQNAPINVRVGPSSSDVPSSATPTSTTSASSASTSETSPTNGASSRNANGAVSHNVNAAASIIAFGLVFLVL